MEVAQPLGVTCSTASLVLQENSFFPVLGSRTDAASRCGLMRAIQRGTIHSLALQAVPLFILLRSCRLPLLPRQSAHHHLLQVIAKDVKVSRSQDRSLQFSAWWSLGRLQCTLSLTVQLSSYPCSCSPVFSLFLPSLWTLCMLLVVIIVVLLPPPPFFSNRDPSTHKADRMEVT